LLFIQSGFQPFFSFFLLDQKEPTKSRQTRSLRAFCQAFPHLGGYRSGDDLSGDDFSGDDFSGSLDSLLSLKI